MGAISVLSQEPRNGSFQSASLAVPADAVFVVAAGTTSDADASDVGKAAIITIRVSYDGQSYVTDPAWRLQWQGGLNKFGLPNQPNLGISVPLSSDGARPQRAMATLDTVGNVLDTGLTLELR